MKAVFLLAALLMIASTGYSQMTASGTFTGDITSDGWSLNGGSGTRTHTVFVKFTKPFSKAPMVLLSLTSYDGAAGKDGNVRVSLKADQITRDGFAIQISTWGDSRVAGVGGNYIAYTNK